MGWSFGVRPQNQTVKDQPTADNAGRIMTLHKICCLAAVLVSLCITFMPGGTNGCTGQVRLTSSISERNACLSEEVTFTCTAQGPVLFWGNEAFGERTMHHTSPPSRGVRDEFRAEIVSYDRNQSCLVSSLSFHATASRNGTTVTCTSRDRSSSQSLSLHIMSNVVLENLTVVPDSYSSVLLEWKVVPTDGHYCIRNYDIQIAGPNGSQWEEVIPGSNHSFHFTGLQLLHLQNYTCCVTANPDHNQIAPIKQTITVELQEPHPPTSLHAVIQCRQGYEIQIDWQAPLSDPLGSPLTGYFLQYHVYDNTSTIELPVLNISYTLDSVLSGAVYNITVSALSEVGPSKNNPSVYLAVPSSLCEGSLATQKTTDSSPLYSITVVITTITFGMAVFSCVLLLAAICFCAIMLRKKTLKQKCKVSKHEAAVSKQEEPHPPTSLHAVIQCRQGYEIQIDWQAPLSDPLGSPVTGYLLEYHVYDNTSIIELAALNTSYTLDSVPSGAVYNITVSALNEVGPSKNNSSVYLAVPSSLCEGFLATQNTSESTDSSPLYSITVITAIAFGVAVFSCVLLLTGICFCAIMLWKKTHKQKCKVSKHEAAVPQQEDQGPPMQNYPIYYTLEPPA